MQLKLIAHSTIPILTAVFLTGCVGYNTALFMTKSNVGLDLDSKPPTAEINISRKEGVVEPSFEGGKTPPVMATFSTKSGTDNKFGNFISGVDQTFSGGDAAVTMAKLFVTNGVPDPDREFDSAIVLSKPPEANSPAEKKRWFGLKRKIFGMPEPGEVRPFFFGTDTQLGVKVGWNGIGGPYPDNVKVGFNRKEIAVAPITFTPIEPSTNSTFRTNVVRIPSFLATVESGVEGGDNVQVSWMQYFATGEAASHLARQPGVRMAMANRADARSAAAAKALEPKSIAETAAVDKALADQKRADEIVNFAKKDDQSLDPAKVSLLVEGTKLKTEDVKDLTPIVFRQKLARSWGLYIDSLYKNAKKQ